MTLKMECSLPFVARKGGRVIDYWSPERTGDYSRDCETGRSYADALMRFLRESEGIHVMPRIVQALPTHKSFDGVEIGFLTRIGDALRGVPMPSETYRPIGSGPSARRSDQL